MKKPYKKQIPQLHCGACMTDFNTTEELNSHLDQCSAAKYLLPLIYQLYGGKDKTGHPLAHFIQCCNLYAHTIKSYAYCIADKMDNLNRSKLHSRLCKELNLEYNSFRPFESSDIKEFPDREKALEILWQALFEYACDNLIK